VHLARHCACCLAEAAFSGILSMCIFRGFQGFALFEIQSPWLAGDVSDCCSRRARGSANAPVACAYVLKHADIGDYSLLVYKIANVHPMAGPGFVTI
jgi:hypothetical protein